MSHAALSHEGLAVRRASWLLLACLGVGAWSTIAHADEKAACVEAADQGQKLRSAHQVVEARDKFRVCAAAGCPAVVQGDCASWLDAVEKDLPNVVPLAKDDAGNGLPGVKVAMDGKPLFDSADGRSVEVDPGTHTFEFEAGDGRRGEKTVVVGQGEKDVRVVVVLGPATPTASSAQQTGATSPATQGASSTPAPGGESGVGMGMQKVLGLAAGGAGVVGVALGSVFGVMTLSAVSQQQTDCASAANCANPSQAAFDHSNATTDRTISIVGFVAGGVLLAGGAVLFFTARTAASESPPAARLLIVPSAGPSGGGISLSGRF